MKSHLYTFAVKDKLPVKLFFYVVSPSCAKRRRREFNFLSFVLSIIQKEMCWFDTQFNSIWVNSVATNKMADFHIICIKPYKQGMEYSSLDFSRDKERSLNLLLHLKNLFSCLKPFTVEHEVMEWLFIFNQEEDSSLHTHHSLISLCHA